MKIWEVKDTTTDKNTRSLHGAFDCECNKHVELTDAKSIYYMTDPRELIEAGIPAQLMLNEGLEKRKKSCQFRKSNGTPKRMRNGSR